MYGSTITDYFELTFWRKRMLEKRKYATWRLHKRFIYEVDNIGDIQYLTNKNNMYNALRPFIKRDQLYTHEMDFRAFKEYIHTNPVFFLKPCENSCGEGIERIDASIQSEEALFERLSTEFAVLDSPICQHDYLSALNKSSVNTLRIFTFRNNNNIYFTGCALRIGTGGFIDNYSAGGLVCSVDLKTGKTIDEAENYLGERFSKHPVSGTQLKGYQIPMWDEIIQYVFEMAQFYSLNYVAWDVAVENNGIDLVEANPAGMINVIQIAGASPKKDLILELESEWKRRNTGNKGPFKIVLCS